MHVQAETLLEVANAHLHIYLFVEPLTEERSAEIESGKCGAKTDAINAPKSCYVDSEENVAQRFRCCSPSRIPRSCAPSRREESASLLVAASFTLEMCLNDLREQARSARFHHERPCGVVSNVRGKVEHGDRI